MAYDVIIVGGGPAGLTAGVYASRRGLKTLLFEKAMFGGQMLLTPSIENYPGFKKVSGMELGQLMHEQAKACGVTFESSEVTGLGLDGEQKTVSTSDKNFEAKTVVLASGGSYRKLGAPGEDEFTGRGVSYCATCDGPFFTGKTVAVVGGGNSAAEEAMYLADIASKVYLIHRRDTLRCEQARVDDMRDKRVEFLLESQVKEFKGDALLTAIDVEGPDGVSELPVDGVFVSVGMLPETRLAGEAGVELDERGNIKVDYNMKTNLPGVFASGDVTGGVNQIATAVGEGAKAALSAYHHIKQPYWK